MRYFYAFTPRDFIEIDGRRKYLWEITRAFDGLMLSKAYVDKKLETEIMERGGVKKYFNIPSEVPVMSDSGGFTWSKLKNVDDYINPKDLLDYYFRLGFNIGIHPDVICRKGKFKRKEKGITEVLVIDEKEAKRRFELNIESARETYELLTKGKYSNLTIYAVVQGWDRSSYKRSAIELLKIGYRHLAIGGLAHAPTVFCREMIKAVVKTVREFEREKGEKVKIHILGVTRTSLLPLMRDLRIDSFDSASWLRAAWLRGAWFWYNPETKQLIEFDVKLFDYRNYHKDPPLPPCSCPICSTVGKDPEGIAWSRRYGTNQRNMSRGFHNLYHFYKWYKEAFLKGWNEWKLIEKYGRGRVLIVTHCVAKKRDIKNGRPFELYDSLRIRKLYEMAKSFKKRFAVISAKYGLVYDDEIIERYDATIKSGYDIDKLLDVIVEKIHRHNPWDLIILYSTNRKYITLLCCALVKANFLRVVQVGKGIFGEMSKIRRVLLRLTNHSILEYI